MKQEQRMTIDFEKDQEEILDKTTNINKLADKIKEMQAVQKAIAFNFAFGESSGITIVAWRPVIFDAAATA